MAKILCIDDEVILRGLIAAELADSGHTVIEAANGREGIDAILAHRPDLVLCDVNMPVMDGYELLETLRKEDATLSDMPFLFLSALADRKDVIAGKRLGADDYLTKPVDIDLLLATVDARLDQVKRIGRRHETARNQDSLTGTLNREGVLAQLEGFGRKTLFLLCEFDHAQSLSLALGYDRAKVLQVQAVERLREVVGAEALLGRTAPLQFAVILDGTAPESGEEVAGALRLRMSEPFHIGARTVHPTMSIGIALGEPAAHLEEQAESALDWCRRDGGNAWTFYRPERAIREIERVVIEDALREAMDHDEFSLAFQPKVRARDLAPVGMEVLLRWTSAGLGPVSPGSFVPVAEETGLILPLGEWVLRSACQTLAGWRAEGLAEHLQMAVNVSPRQIRSEDWVPSVRRALADAGVPPAALILEITEGDLVDERVDIISRLTEVRDLGVMLSIDDFGTGYSSLSYLHRLPVQEIKIDQSFVRGLADKEGTSRIVNGIISLARQLNLKMVAEGVETPDQLSYLTERGCDVIQGYYVSRPLPAEAFRAWLADRSAKHS